jgi:hypothetical protein
MGFLSSLFGSSKSQPQVTQVQQTQKLPDEIAPKVAEVADEAKRLYDERVATGYEGYGAATIAPFTQQELDSQAGIEGLVGTSGPLQQEALGIIRQAGEQFTGDTAQQYMNPYQQAVIDVEKRQAMQDYTTRILPQFEKQAVDAGGMSGLGSRAGVQAALLGEAQGQRLGDIQSKGLQQAYAQGRAEFNAQKVREQQQATDLNRAGPAMFASGLAEQGALAQVGETRRDLAQTALDEAYFKYLEEKGEPQAALAEYSNTIYGNPLNAIPSMNKTTTAPGQQGPSSGSQLLGLGMQAASMYYGGGFGGMGGGMKAKEGGRLSEGLSGVVYRQKAGQVLPTNIEREMRQRGLLKKEDDMYGEETADVSSPVFTKEDILKQNREIFDINRQLEGTTDADEIRILQSKREEIRNNPPVAPAPAPQSSQGLTAVAEDISRGVVSPYLQGQGLMVSEEIDPANPTGLARATRTPQPAPPNEETYDVGKDILRRLAGMDDRVASEVADATKEDLTYRTDRNKLMADQRKAESEAFNKLSDSQTTRLADEMLRRREEITGRDGNITLSKAFGVAAKSFSDPNLSIVQQISGAMGGMTETMVSERVLKREQLSELDKEEFDKETLIIDRKLERNLETMQKNNAQDLSVLNLDRAGQKELAALPAQKRKDILENASSLASIFDDLLPDADSTKAFDISKTREDLRGAVAVKFGFTFDRQTGMVTKNGKPLEGADARKMSNLTEYGIEVLNKRYQLDPTKTGGSNAYVFAAAEAEAARKRMDALGPEPTEEQQERAMRGSAAPAATSMLDQAVAAYNNDPSSISPEKLQKLNAALISEGRPTVGN